MDEPSPTHARIRSLLVGAFALLAVAAMSQSKAQQAGGDAADARWRSVLDSPDRRVLIDTSSIQRSKGLVTFWLKHQFLPASRGQVLDRWAIDCRARTSWPLEAMAYDDQGRQTKVAPAPPSPLKMAIAPESNIEAIMACVCEPARRS